MKTIRLHFFSIPVDWCLRTILRSALVTLLLMGTFTLAFTQWSPNPAINTAICTATGIQDPPVAVSDGSGGVILAWEDHRNGIDSDIYAQRLNDSGVVQWTANGVAICTATGDQSDTRIISDGAGGAIITWLDYRGAVVGAYAQRINASGLVQWTANGVAVCSSAVDQYSLALTSDGAGGAIFAWEDYRNDNDYNIFMQRLNASGFAQWADTGVAICTASNNQDYPALVSDGAGGAVIAWIDYRNSDATDMDIYCQRINSSGTALWMADGLAICTAAGNQEDLVMVSDGANGGIVCWQDHRGTDADIYAQRILANGSAFWTSNGLAVCSAGGYQTLPVMVSDGKHGAIVAWEDTRSSPYNDIYAAEVTAEGSLPWPDSSVAVCTESGVQSELSIVSDGEAGAILTWVDSRNSSTSSADLYTQHLDTLGTAQWAEDGIVVCNALGFQQYPAMVSDGAGGGIVAWEDSRSGVPDIYAQKIIHVIPAEQVTLVSPEYGATAQLTNPVFTWHKTADAASYHLKIATTDTFGVSVKDLVVTDTTLVTSGLGYLTTYYWKVAGRNIIGDGPWSDVWQFTTTVPPTPNAPTLVAPANGAANQLASPVLRWTATYSTIYYTVQVARNSGFGGGGVITADVVDTFMTVGALSKNTTYYWHVRAANDSLQGSWSPTWSFTTMNLAAPRAPALLGPRNRTTGLSAPVTLQWKASSGATSYHLLVTPAGISTGPTADTITGLLSYTLRSLDPGKTYYWRVSAIGAAGEGDWSREWEFTTALGAKTVPLGLQALPESFMLGQNYPNPFNPTTVFTYALPVDAHVRITIYNTLGQTVGLLADGVQEAGYQTLQWDASMQSAGVYLYRLEATAASDPANHFVQTRKMILVK